MQADSFRNRTAIVTGGARGIGLACAEKIAAGGGRVALWDRDMVRARQSAASLKSAIAIEVDVADAASIAQAGTSSGSGASGGPAAQSRNASTPAKRSTKPAPLPHQPASRPSGSPAA